MKAFLSHSSKDKNIVRQVAKVIGESRCEYDEYTFEYTLSQQAIRRALSRSGLFVLFLSDSSIKSSFVDDEIRSSLEFRGRGVLEKFLIIALDGTSYKALPEWLQAYNIVNKLHSPASIARKIEASLFSLEASKGDIHYIYIPREDEDKKLRSALSKPAGIAPIALHAVGHYGVGRRTFLRNTISNIFRRITFVPISFGRFEGINE